MAKADSSEIAILPIVIPSAMISEFFIIPQTGTPPAPATPPVRSVV
jgi:hypothetical protein